MESYKQANLRIPNVCYHEQIRISVSVLLLSGPSSFLAILGAILAALFHQDTIFPHSPGRCFQCTQFHLYETSANALLNNNIEEIGSQT